MTADKNDVEYWKSLKPGSFVTLNDNQTIEMSIEQSGNLGPLQFEVDKVIEVRESNDLMMWRFFILTSNEETLWLCAKIVDSKFDLRIYFVPEDFDQGDRSDQIEWDNLWLFQEPGDTDDFKIEELLYTKNFEREDDSKDITYSQKGQGELNGKVSEFPVPSGQSNLLATISEYQSESGKNPEAMFLEIGNPLSETGGIIKLLVGYPLSIGEIDPLAA